MKEEIPKVINFQDARNRLGPRESKKASIEGKGELIEFKTKNLKEIEEKYKELWKEATAFRKNMKDDNYNREEAIIDSDLIVDRIDSIKKELERAYDSNTKELILINLDVLRKQIDMEMEKFD
jgi:hypothetical protein